MQPQSMAARLLPAETYKMLVQYSLVGVPTDCGPDWLTEAIEVARTMGPHVSAMTPENVDLVWEEIAYQVEAGFVTIVPEQELLTQGMAANIKISWLAVVWQRNRRGWLILNLSAGVELPLKNVPGSWRKQKRVHMAVNETTTPADDQWAVKRLGSAMADALLFRFESPSALVEDRPVGWLLADDRPSQPGAKLRVRAATPPQAPREMDCHPVSAADGVDEQPNLFLHHNWGNATKRNSDDGSYPCWWRDRAAHVWRPLRQFGKEQMG
jgi:hypothetical protein